MTQPGNRPSPLRRRSWRGVCAGVLAALAAGVSACSKAPVTERLQFNLIPDAIMLPLGKASYGEMLAGVRLERRTGSDSTLKQVGKRISRVADKPRYSWQYKLIKDDNTVNAWCLPGGKIAFYTGILPVLQNEAGMAFVMGHEVGHATAHHGAERLSQQLAVLGGLSAVYLYMERDTELNETQKGVILGALGVGAQVGFVLPFSRKHEKEADTIGMMYMARAGYTPEESIQVWTRMQRMTGGGGVPQFLSTHPTNRNRKKNLQEWLPQARKRYERNKRNDSEDATGTVLWR